jgi:hypothetical protein
MMGMRYLLKSISYAMHLIFSIISMVEFNKDLMQRLGVQVASLQITLICLDDFVNDKVDRFADFQEPLMHEEFV